MNRSAIPSAARPATVQVGVALSSIIYVLSAHATQRLDHRCYCVLQARRLQQRRTVAAAQAAQAGAAAGTEEYIEVG